MRHVDTHSLWPAVRKYEGQRIAGILNLRMQARFSGQARVSLDGRNGKNRATPVNHVVPRSGCPVNIPGDPKQFASGETANQTLGFEFAYNSSHVNERDGYF